MDLLDALRTHRLLAIVRTKDPGAALDLVLTLADAASGWSRWPSPRRTRPGPSRRCAQSRPATPWLGAGTVLTAADVAAGGRRRAPQFLVTPASSPRLAEAAALGLPVAGRGAHPDRGRTPQCAGAAAAVKLFPASRRRARRTCKALRDPFPDIPFVAVGGVGLPTCPATCAAGAIAVGVGGAAGRRRRLRSATWPPCGFGPGAFLAAWPRRCADDRIGPASPSARPWCRCGSAGPLAAGGTATMHLAGAESNVAIGLARLGHRAAWVGRVERRRARRATCCRQLRAEGVDSTA